MIFRLGILVILVLTTSNISVFAFPGNDTDQQALLSFKASITADPSGVLDSWNNSIHFCQWNGITCSPRRQRATVLNLSSQHLVGTFSPHIGNLSFLRGIYLSQNNFHGSIPNEIGLLFRLQNLDLGLNSFQGGCPPNLSNCADIRNITMSHNNLEGKLPTTFASWPKLYWFDLQENHFTGSIPPLIGNTSSLHFLHLRANNLVGNIPSEVAHHTKLEVLCLSLNYLSGMVPRPLYNLSSLYIFSLTQNKLKRTLPADLGVTLPRLQGFLVSANRFSGPLPASITNASDLTTLDVVVNSITGTIPNNLGSLPNLEWLNLGHNPLGDSTRPDDLSFFNFLANCTHLYHLGLGQSGLRGQLPNSIINLSTTIQLLFLYSNHINGSIPREIRKLKNLSVLSFSDNLLTGTIPESI
ncbi:hypothetical protein DCAR_0104841 [Daucus carota subsp. sativus]|uniref:Leucine-rich repeat-containing N-terminal plant-type domain-containing protein n=1 Tax=Daucus carota subsp. sativus TaxID=79200 RepID=A0AAF1AMM6_DAUCS|nr:PREDICTED: LRR receptor-like serine/threonine-protein kinase EFR isoform X1 [Daucus carota subsp. sativus]XP_017258751.1 PREDICTED: LRR receptor-like serine/threonine-protein kinase EFR isoform X1 [Daucus carota subsp. sativus]WOG85650.1 hypothetical protein DCAR_0104841 [Daucus carota subsp. sativus]